MQAVKIDEKLFSRQLYVLGDQAMAKMLHSSVFLSGLGGLGVEIAKNIALAGVKLLTLNDIKKASLFDLGTQFYLSEADIGQNRATVSAPKVAELNPHHVKVQASETDLSVDANLSVLDGYKIVIVTDAPLSTLLKVGEYCHKKGISFIAADVKGLFLYTFVDFGARHEVNDPDGEEAKTATLANITQASPAIATVLENQRHDLEDGDWVEFSEVKGMTALNKKQYEIKVLNPQSFSIQEDTTKIPPFQVGGGGIATQIKKPKQHEFLSFNESLEKPNFVLTDYVRMDEGAHQLLNAFRALWQYEADHKNLPAAWNRAEADAVVALAQKLKPATGPAVDEARVRALASTARGATVGLTAFAGGVVAQEALKGLTGKYTPIKQWLMLDAVDLLPTGEAKTFTLEAFSALDPAQFQPRGDRSDAMRVCVGQTLCEKLHHLKLFMIGAGAIGCEMLKNFAMLGIATGDDGRIIITDNDLIEMSNLNRQFLFREKHIHTPKSTTAAASTKAMNPKMRIDAEQDKICPETENKYNDDFFTDLDVVVNALDNVAARLYVDSRCVANQRPLLESGTLGTKGHVQVILPFLTETYGSRRDPPEKDVPYCTLKSFPAQMEHCIQWARDFSFETQFASRASSANSLFEEGDVHERLSSIELSKLREVKLIHKTLSRRPKNFDDCLVWGRNKFQAYFYNSIKQLLHNFPLDHKLKDGTPFWAAPKRPPTPLEFNAKDPLHASFVIAAAALYADMWKIPLPKPREALLQDTSALEKAVANVKYAAWKPKAGKHIVTDENKNKDEAQKVEHAPESADDELRKATTEISKWVRTHAANTRVSLKPADFEKDDDSNFHIDFIAATSNLRARAYGIAEADRLRIKRIAGKIIPAIATTTAAVSGLVSLELVKVVAQKPLEHFKNAFLNLGICLFAFSEPQPVEKNKITEGVSTSIWDRWEVDEGDITLAEFIKHLETSYKLKVSAVCLGAIMVYMPLFGHAKRLPEKMSKLLGDTGQVAKNAKHVDLIVSFANEAGDDVQGPTVRFVMPSTKRVPKKKK